MYQNQASNLSRITAYYGYPSQQSTTHGNNNNKQLDESNNVSMYSTKKIGDDTLNKSQSSPKSPNTSELLIQNIGGKVSDLSKEVNRLMVINDKLLSDISLLNGQNQNKDHLIKLLQERLSQAEKGLQVNHLNSFNYNNQNINSSATRMQEKEESFQQSSSKQKIQNNNILQPRSGVSPFSNINNIINQNPIQNGGVLQQSAYNNTNGNHNINDEQQRYTLNSVQVNSELPDTAANFLFNSNLTQSVKTKNGSNNQLSPIESTNGFNQIPTNPTTSPWSVHHQDERYQKNITNPVSPLNSTHATNNGVYANNEQYQQNQGITPSNNKVLMLASFQDRQSGGSSDQVNNQQPQQIAQYQEEIENLKREKMQLQMSLSDLKQKYEEQQKEHAREIAQLKTNMFNSVVESDNFSKDEEDDHFNINNIEQSYDKNVNELVNSIEVDDKLLEGRFRRKENENLFVNNSFSASKDQQLQKSNVSHQNNNNHYGMNADQQSNLVVSQEFMTKSQERLHLINSQQNIQQQNLVISNQSDKAADQKRNSIQQLTKRNSIRQGGLLNGTNSYRDNIHLLEVMEQLEICKKENSSLKQELRLAKDELLFISSQDPSAHGKNEQLRIIAAKLKLEQDEEIMKYRIRNEELQSEIKKQSSLNKNLQSEILKLKEGLQSHNRSSTIMDEKTLENLFDSEIESDEEDLEDDGYGDRDSKQIRKHKNEILNTMTNNEKIYNNIIYLKRKNRRLEDQLQEWKRQYWLLEKSTQNHNHHHHQNNANNQNKPNNNNQNQNNNQNNQPNQPPTLQQQTSQGSNPDKSSQFEFNFSQYLQYQQKASKKAPQISSAPLESNNDQKQTKSNSSSFQRNEGISQCDTPAIGTSVNQGRAEPTYQNSKMSNYQNNQQLTAANVNNINGVNHHEYNISNNNNNAYDNFQDQIRYNTLQQQMNKITINENLPKSAEINHFNHKNFDTINQKSDQLTNKETQFSSYNPYNLSSNYQILKYDQLAANPVTQFSPSDKISSSTQNLTQRNNEVTLDHIAKITEEKKVLEKGVKTAIKDIRDQVNQLQKRKAKNAPLSQSHQNQVSGMITKINTKSNLVSTSQKGDNILLHKNPEFLKQYQSTSGLQLVDSKSQVNNSTTKISHLINNFKKLNLDKPTIQPNTYSSQSNRNLNFTNASSNNTSQNMVNLTCQTDRQILYNISTQPSAQSQSPIGHQNQYSSSKVMPKIGQTASSTPKALNAKHTVSVHQTFSNHTQQQQMKTVLHTQPNLLSSEKNTTFNNRDSANLSYETSKSQLLHPTSGSSNANNNYSNKSPSPMNNTKQYPKQIEQSYSNNFVYQKAKFNQRIKDKYN